MTTDTRRYDIDWLRVIAIALLLIYHITIAFQPWAVLIGFVQNNKPLEWLWIPMSMLNVWRIPLLFFVSGMGVCFAMRKRTVRQLLFERMKRILLPLLFGMFVIVPIHVVLWQQYYNQDLTYFISRSHLWFLSNIFIYVLILLPLFYLLKKHQAAVLNSGFSRFMKNPLSLIIFTALFVLEAIVFKPEMFSLYAMTPHGFAMGFIAFFLGFIFVYSGLAFWQNVSKFRWVLLILSVSLYALRYIKFELVAPNYLLAIESCCWVFTVFGFGHMYLNKPGKVLNYLSKGAYPIYIVHMLFLYLGSVLIFPMTLSPQIKLVLVTLFTFAGCWLSYEFLIRRIKYVGVLFGLKS